MLNFSTLWYSNYKNPILYKNVKKIVLFCLMLILIFFLYLNLMIMPLGALEGQGGGMSKPSLYILKEILRVEFFPVALSLGMVEVPPSKIVINLPSQDI